MMFAKIMETLLIAVGLLIVPTAQAYAREPDLDNGAEINEVCAGCHSLHHVVTVDCRLCHTQDPKSNHQANLAHVTACTVCHTAPDQAGLTQWSRNVCLVCHQTREEHSGGMECTLCHEIAPLPRRGGGGNTEGGGGSG